MKDQAPLTNSQLDKLKTLYYQAGPDTSLTSTTLSTWRSSVSKIIGDLPWPSANTSEFRNREREFRRELDEMRRPVKEMIVRHEATFEDDLPTQFIDTSFHPQLWLHVKHNVEHQQWAQVASGTVLFVENTLRKLLKDPRNNSGQPLNPQALFAMALNDDHFGLGDKSNSNEGNGWRQIGLGFVAAISNTDRHNIQERADIKVYAMGVLGLGSLLLTQIEHDHPNLYRPRIGIRPWTADEVRLFKK